MNKLRKILALALVLVFALSMLGITAAAEEAVVVKIVHTNDMHSRYAEAAGEDGTLTQVGYARLSTYIKSLGENAFYVDAGDTLHGDIFANLEEGASIVRILNEIGLTAMVPGNHDFNYGYERLLELDKLLNGEIIATNVTKDGKNLFTYSYVKEVAGKKIGIIGISTPDTKISSHPDNTVGVEFGTKEQIIEGAKKAVADLGAVDAVVALMHVGIDKTSSITSDEIVAAVDGIDVAIDGHSHSTIDKYSIVKETVMTSTGNYSQNIGLVTLTFEGDTLKIEAEALPAAQFTTVEPDAKVAALIAEVSAEQEALKSQVVANIPFDLDGERSSVRFGSTNLGRLISAAAVEATGADFCISNGGNIRASIPAGDITKGQALTVLPFGNILVTKAIKGSDIIPALEQSLAQGGGVFLQPYGVEVNVQLYDDAGAIRGKVTSATIGGEAIDPDKTYTVVTNDFLAAGGDGCTVLAACPKLGELNSMEEAFINFLATAPAEKIAEVANNEATLVLAPVVAEPVVAVAEAEEGDVEEVVDPEEEVVEDVVDDTEDPIVDTGDSTVAFVCAVAALVAVAAVAFVMKKRA